VDDGPADESPSRQREPYQRDRYGDRWAPLLIAWQSSGENSDFAADVTGEANSQPVGLPGKPTMYVTGQVMLDSSKIGAFIARPNAVARAQAQAIVLHGLGHLVGLAHRNDPSQIMFPEAHSGVEDYAAGDLAGLAQLGTGGCAPGDSAGRKSAVPTSLVLGRTNWPKSDAAAPGWRDS
jgi:Matrixin